MEYALNTQPRVANANPIVHDLEALADGLHLRITVPRKPAAANLSYLVETCGNLGDGSSDDTTIETNHADQLVVRDKLVD